jgi:hypothetical protein
MWCGCGWRGDGHVHGRHGQSHLQQRLRSARVPALGRCMGMLCGATDARDGTVAQVRCVSMVSGAGRGTGGATDKRRHRRARTGARVGRLLEGKTGRVWLLLCLHVGQVTCIEHEQRVGVWMLWWLLLLSVVHGEQRVAPLLPFHHGRHGGSHGVRVRMRVRMVVMAVARGERDAVAHCCEQKCRRRWSGAARR